MSKEKLSIPPIGLGTWRLAGEQAKDMIQQALDLGYRHIDTAQMYGNEDEVGLGLRASGCAREEVFVTTKVWWENLRQGKFQKSVEESLRKLRFEYVDLLLIHWPHPELPLSEYLEELVRMQDLGWAREIGVSNFTPELLEQACRIAPDIRYNQVEYHPFLGQQELIRRSMELDVRTVAYRPIANGEVVNSPVLQDLASQYGKTPVQIALRWLIQQNGVAAAIPKTSKSERLKENFNVFDFELSPSDMDAIFALGRQAVRMVDPDFAPQWPEEKKG